MRRLHRHGRTVFLPGPSCAAWTDQAPSRVATADSKRTTQTATPPARLPLPRTPTSTVARPVERAIERWTAPTPRASNPAKPVHRCLPFSTGLNEKPERVYATAAGTLLRRQLPRRRAPCWCSSSSANDPERPRTRQASSRLCSQSASTSATKRSSIDNGGKSGDGSGGGGERRRQQRQQYQRQQ